LVNYATEQSFQIQIYGTYQDDKIVG